MFMNIYISFSIPSASPYMYIMPFRYLIIHFNVLITRHQTVSYRIFRFQIQSRLIYGENLGGKKKSRTGHVNINVVNIMEVISRRNEEECKYLRKENDK